MSDWGAKDVQEWKPVARNEQQIYYNRLSDRRWDFIKYEQWQILERKVAFGVYGEPSRLPSDNNNDDIGYTDEQMKHVKKICKTIHEQGKHRKNKRDIWFSCVFVCGKIWDKRFTIPVFKTLKHCVNGVDYDMFIDTDCRVYDGWADYLNKNTLPKCMYCYPRNGIYSGSKGKVEVDYGTSPACDLVNRIFSILDWTATAVTLTATGVGVVALCAIPVAGPIAAAATIGGVSAGTYGAARSGYSLIDRSMHEQSIGLDDAQARNCWLGLVGGSLSFAQLGMVASMTTSARAGFVMSSAGRITYMTVSICSLSVNGLGIINSVAVIIDKSVNGELRALDMVQFSASLLFFTNSLVNFQTASDIIKQVQHDVINNHRKDLPADHQEIFDKLAADLRGQREMHGNAKVVRAVNSIENAQDFYKSLGSMHEQHDFESNLLKLTERGLVEINKEFVVHPKKFLQIDSASREQILQETRELSNKGITVETFNQRMKNICRVNRLQFECQRMETLKRLCDAFKVTDVKDIKIGNNKIFNNLQPHEIHRISGVMTGTAKNYKPEIIKIASDFAKSRGCNNVGDFCAYLEYAVHHFNEMKKADLQKYREDPASFPNVTGKHNVYFENKIYSDYLEGNSTVRGEFIKDLKANFDRAVADVKTPNQSASCGFRNLNLAAYHYVKHKVWGSGDAARTVSPQEYYAIADEAIGLRVDPGNKILSQEGNVYITTYNNPVNGAKVVTVERSGDAFLATVMYDKTLQRGL